MSPGKVASYYAVPTEQVKQWIKDENWAQRRQDANKELVQVLSGHANDALQGAVDLSLAMVVNGLKGLAYELKDQKRQLTIKEIETISRVYERLDKSKKAAQLISNAEALGLGMTLQQARMVIESDPFNRQSIEPKPGDIPVSSTERPE